jgi:hypothetical protein
MLQLVFCYLTVPQYLGKQSPSNVFTTMNRNYGTPAILMLKEVEAALDAHNIETKISQGADQPATGYGWERTHRVKAMR